MWAGASKPRLHQCFCERCVTGLFSSLCAGRCTHTPEAKWEAIIVCWSSYTPSRRVAEKEARCNIMGVLPGRGICSQASRPHQITCGVSYMTSDHMTTFDKQHILNQTSQRTSRTGVSATGYHCRSTCTLFWCAHDSRTDAPRRTFPISSSAGPKRGHATSYSHDSSTERVSRPAGTSLLTSM